MNTLAIILSRAGSKGLNSKAVLPLCGRPVICHTFDHALQSDVLNGVCVTTDTPRVKALARRAGIHIVDRPPELATDTAPVVYALHHALQDYEANHRFYADAIVALYGNVPVRAPGIIDRAVEHLIETGADSVRTVAPIGKHHPDWLHRLDGDLMIQHRPNKIHRRQDLSPLYYHDGAVLAVTRQALFSEPESPDDYLAFFGQDRRAIVQDPLDTIDIDELADLYYAEAVIRVRSEDAFFRRPAMALTTRPALTGAVAVGRNGRR